MFGNDRTSGSIVLFVKRLGGGSSADSLSIACSKVQSSVPSMMDNSSTKCKGENGNEYKK
jgi:hypothetical protein